jgi:hypothetical protein
MKKLLSAFAILALTLPLAAAGDLGPDSDAQAPDRKYNPLYLASFSIGMAWTHSGNGRTFGKCFDFSRVKNHVFLGARIAVASFSPHTDGNDFSLLYGREWGTKGSLFCIASGMGYSSCYRSLGLPIDFKITAISSAIAGISLGIHCFAFMAPHDRYLSICLSLGVFGSSDRKGGAIFMTSNLN